uniref:Uncharacterized protein n=1 Tax=Panagrolaimus sp. JU765 TaxID=591449 RepID=A0AC34R7A5_9BILA
MIFFNNKVFRKIWKNLEQVFEWLILPRKKLDPAHFGFDEDDVNDILDLNDVDKVFDDTLISFEPGFDDSWSTSEFQHDSEPFGNDSIQFQPTSAGNDPFCQVNSDDIRFLEEIIFLESQRTDLEALFDLFDDFFSLIDHLYLEASENAPNSTVYINSSSGSSSEEFVFPDPDSLPPKTGKRGRKKVYHGQDRKWATWRNNWVYNQRKLIQKDVKQAELTFLTKKNEFLQQEFFELTLEAEFEKASICEFNWNRIQMVADDFEPSNHFCHCKTTGKPCPDLFFINFPVHHR